MGRLDSLAESYFKTGITGHRIYYPFGIFGRGRILSEEAEEKNLKRIMKWVILASIPIYTVVLTSALPFWAKMSASCSLLAGQYALQYMPVRHHRVADERMSLMESWRISVQRSGKRTRWTLFGLGTLMTSLGVFTVFASHGDVWEKLVLLGGTVFFGAVSLIYLLLAREAERPD